MRPPPAYSFTLADVAHPNVEEDTTTIVQRGDTRTGKVDKLEADLAREAQKAVAARTTRDPLQHRAHRAHAEQGTRHVGRDTGVVRAVGPSAHEWRSGRAQVHQLKQWQDDLGYSPMVWTTARKVLHFETHPLGRSEPWEQRLDDSKLDWLSRRCSPPGDDEWTIHVREGFS